MIVVELSFEATPERLAARPDHRATLEALTRRGVLRLAGPWADDSGALLVFDVDREQVAHILSVDPYYTTSGVTVVSVRQWNPIAGQALTAP